MHSAVAGRPSGALRGRSTAAREAVMRTLMEIDEVANVDAFVEKAIGERATAAWAWVTASTSGRSAGAILQGMAEDACRQSGQFNGTRWP